MIQIYDVLQFVIALLIGIVIVFTCSKQKKDAWIILYAFAAGMLVRMVSGAIKFVVFAVQAGFEMERINYLIEHIGTKWFMFELLLFIPATVFAVVFWRGMQNMAQKVLRSVSILMAIAMVVSLFMNDWQITVIVMPVVLIAMFYMMVYRNELIEEKQKRLYYHKELEKQTIANQAELDAIRKEVAVYYQKAGENTYQQEVLSAIDRIREKKE